MLLSPIDQLWSGDGLVSKRLPAIILADDYPLHKYLLSALCVENVHFVWPHVLCVLFAYVG